MALAILAIGPAFAASGSVADDSPRGARASTAAPRQSGGVSLDQAIDMVQRRYGARVVRTDVVEEGGRRVYVLRLLSSDGRVWSVRVDAASGAISQ